MRGLRSAFGFLTPLFGAAEPGPAALPWFPVVGAFAGLVVGSVWWVAARAWPAGVAAALAVSADAAVTGLLHLDGLCDAADGLLAPMPQERRLEVMAEPRAGAFGAAALALVLLSRWAAFTAIRPSVLVAVGLWMASRTWMATSVAVVPYARTTGLASAFVDDHTRRRAVPLVVAGMAASLIVAMAWRVVPGFTAVSAGSAAAVVVIALGVRRIGGYTGDVLGAAGVVGETVGLIVAAARW